MPVRPHLGSIADVREAGESSCQKCHKSAMLAVSPCGKLGSHKSYSSVCNHKYQLLQRALRRPALEDG